MGYTTDFTGRFSITPPLPPERVEYLKKFSETRRMARKVGAIYGVEGEFFVDGTGPFGQGQDKNIIDFNRPPKTQPGLWCQWVPTEDGSGLEWNGAEKFYDYTAWLEYIIKNFLAPFGHVLNGRVKWRGEDSDDIGVIIVKDNVVTRKELDVNKLLGMDEADPEPTPPPPKAKRKPVVPLYPTMLKKK